MKRRILFNHPISGKQILILCYGISPDIIPLWDEEIDGEFPTDLLSEVGGLVRNNDQLEIDSAKRTAYEAAKIAGVQKEEAKESALFRLKALDTSKPLADSDVAIRDLIEVLLK